MKKWLAGRVALACAVLTAMPPGATAQEPLAVSLEQLTGIASVMFRF